MQCTLIMLNESVIQAKETNLCHNPPSVVVSVQRHRPKCKYSNKVLLHKPSSRRVLLSLSCDDLSVNPSWLAELLWAS